MTQRKRNLGEERQAVVNKEVTTFLEVDFIRRTTYTTWFANVVRVKKVSDKSRMCSTT